MICPFNRRTALIFSINVSVIVYVFYVLFLVPSSSPQLSRNVSMMRLNPKIAISPSGTLSRVSMRYTEEELERLMISQEARRIFHPRDLINRVKEIGLGLTDGSEKQKDDEGLAQPPEGMRNAEQDSDRSSSGALEVLRREEESMGRLDGGKLLLEGPEIEDGIIPGRPVPAECNAEPHTDYDGVAVRWGLSHPQESAADCCQACLDQALTAKAGDLKCNLWVYCPAEEGCYSPDIYRHEQFECWLKQSETPRINFKGRYPPEYRQANPTCPQVVPWASGVVVAA